MSITGVSVVTPSPNQQYHANTDDVVKTKPVAIVKSCSYFVL